MAKEVSVGGNPNVLIAKPEITKYKINSKTDFICIGCDGIFDKYKSKEISSLMWDYY